MAGSDTSRSVFVNLRDAPLAPVRDDRIYDRRLLRGGIWPRDKAVAVSWPATIPVQGSIWIDLRTKTEIGPRAPDSPIERVHFPIQEKAAVHSDRDHARQYVAGANLYLAAALQVLSCLVGHRTVIVTCAMGKDRTGCVVALVLLALGLPEEAIVGDYTASEQELRARPDVLHLRNMATDRTVCRAADIRALLASVRSDGSSVDRLRRHYERAWIA